MRRAALVLLLVVLCAELVYGGWFSSEETPKKKTKGDLGARSSQDGYSKLSANEFKKHVSEKKNRTYSVVTFLTASEQCEPCKQVEEQFLLVASSFRKQHPNNARLQFVMLRLEEARAAFHELQVQSLPNIIHIPPVKKGVSTLYDPKHDIHKLMTSQGWTASGISNFVYDRTGVAIDVPKAFLSHRGGGGGGGPFAFLGVSEKELISYLLITVALVGTGLVYTGTWRHFLPYFIAVLFAWYLLISGMVYNIITEPAPHGRNRDGSPNYIHPSSHSQYGMEGFQMGFLAVGMVVVLLVANEGVPYLANRASKRSPGRRTLSIMLLNSTCIVLILFSFYLFATLKSFYKRKMGGYPF